MPELVKSKEKKIVTYRKFKLNNKIKLLIHLFKLMGTGEGYYNSTKFTARILIGKTPTHIGSEYRNYNYCIFTLESNGNFYKNKYHKTAKKKLEIFKVR